MAADLPRNYQAKLDAFQFIRDVPVDWQHSKAIAGAVGDYIVMARKDRHSEDWYVGGLTDEQARTVTVPLDFLTAGKTYQAEIYKDGDKAHWVTAPYDISIKNQRVSANQKLKIKMAESGGFAIRFKHIE